MTRQQLYTLLLVTALLPFFIPQGRDTLARAYTLLGLDRRVAQVRDTGPAVLTVLRLAQKAAGTRGAATLPKVAPTDFSLSAGCTLSPESYDAVLAEYGSPAVGTGQASVEDCQKYHIDNGYVLAIFIHESGAGTNPAWAGKKPDGHTTANVGNVVAAPGRHLYGRFADFEDDWKAGTEAVFALLAEYRDTDHYGNPPHRHTTIRDVLNTWAPANENDPAGYADTVEGLVSKWRLASGGSTAVRSKLVEYALSRRGDPYVWGGRNAGGSDCSGFVQLVYTTVVGVDPGATTFALWDNNPHISLAEVKPGDVWIGAWGAGLAANEQHAGIVADVDGDGRWDLINNGANAPYVHVDYGFMTQEIGTHTKGFLRILPQ